jgi:multiple sugar transport system substrate-binding protein
MSPEIDSEFYARSLIWSYGGSEQDAHDNPTLDAPEVVEAVKFQTELFKKAETPEVFSWNAASNNEGFIAGHLNYIQNSISFYRSSQDVHPDVAQDTGFITGLAGPKGEVRQTSHVWYIYVVPKYVTDKNKLAAAKKFVLDLEANYSNAVYYSKMYNFPAFPSTVPQLSKEGGWLTKDPWGSIPADKLKLLADSEKVTAWLGYPGYANPAVSEVYLSRVLSAMMASAARGEKTPEQAVKDAADQVRKIYDKWRAKGFLGEGKK